MQITRQADYAVRAVFYLAQRDPVARVTTAEIAEKQHIPLTFLAKIIAQLSTAGLVRSTRGAHGGVALARPAGEISLLDIVEVIDGPMLLNECVADPTACPLGADCAVQHIWCDVQSELVERLAHTSFAYLASYHPPAAALAPA